MKLVISAPIIPSIAPPSVPCPSCSKSSEQYQVLGDFCCLTSALSCFSTLFMMVILTQYDAMRPRFRHMYAAWIAMFGFTQDGLTAIHYSDDNVLFTLQCFCHIAHSHFGINIFIVLNRGALFDWIMDSTEEYLFGLWLTILCLTACKTIPMQHFWIISNKIWKILNALHCKAGHDGEVFGYEYWRLHNGWWLHLT